MAPLVSLKKIPAAAIRHEGPAILTEPKDLQNSQFMLDDVLTGVFKDPQDGAAHTALESGIHKGHDPHHLRTIGRTVNQSHTEPDGEVIMCNG